MHRFNLSEWAISRHTLMVFFMILVVVAGADSYFRLGQNEDPSFVVHSMVVRAYLPGASMEETTLQLTDRLEKKLEETPDLEYLKSYTLAGETTIFVNLLSGTPAERVPDDWYQVRKKVADLAHELPAETVGPFFDDEFGDVYGIIYAFTAGPGFTHRELKDCVERARREFVRVPDVEKVTIIGAQDEKCYVEYSPRALATLGVTRAQLVAALTRQNALTPSGVVDTGEERISVETSGAFMTAEDIANVGVYAGGRRVRVGDVATVTRACVDPPSIIFRRNGQDAIGLGVSMRSGGDVLQLERNMARAMERVQASLPVGMQVHQVSNQPTVVRMAVHDFTSTLFEAVVIVMVLSFLSLGLRAGAVVSLSIPFVLCLTFCGMRFWGIDLQRVSLGALIISLGMLVDDAVITIESMVARLELGWKLRDAACYAYTSTAFPMLTGTLITICGFIPIGLTESMAGEYCFSLFAVVAMALLFSWFVAVLFAPPLGMKALHEGYRSRVTGVRAVQRVFDAMLLAAVRHPVKTVAAALALFALSLAGMRLVPMQFFPPSERPELLVDMTLRQGVSIRATDGVARRLDAILAKDPDVDHWSTYVGRGAVRFYLPLDEQLPNTDFAQAVVITRGTEERGRVQRRLRQVLADEFPEVLARVTPMEMGPPVGWPVGYRVSGEDSAQVEVWARKAAAVMAASPDTRSISFNWIEQGRKLKVRVRQEEARRLGLSSSDIAQTVYAAVTGAAVTQIRDGIYLVDVVLRADRETRTDIAGLATLDVQLANGRSVPLGAVADVAWEQEAPLIWRRDRLPAITVQCDTADGVLPATVVARLRPEMDRLRADLPPGMRIADAGTVEETSKNLKAVFDALPIMAVLMLCALMVQMQNFRHLFLVVSVIPLGLAGVVGALLVTGSPMGYVALLGVVALVGIIARNSVILVHQIDMEIAAGLSTWDAVIQAARVRFRPIILTAVTTILGMYPIASASFWGPMAYAIMGGLAVATVLTLVFIPALYVLMCGVRENGGSGGPGAAGAAAAKEAAGEDGAG